MSKKKLCAELKNKHGIDVEALQEQASQRADMSQLTAVLTEALKPAGELELTGKKGKRKGEVSQLGMTPEHSRSGIPAAGTCGQRHGCALLGEPHDAKRLGLPGLDEDEDDVAATASIPAAVTN